MTNRAIALDARMWNHPGIGRYIRELSGELIHCLKDERLTFLGDPGVIRSFFFSRHPASEPSLVKVHSKIYSLFEQWEIPRKSKAFDLLHVPHFNAPIFLKTRLVTTIHDLIYFHEPGASRSRFGQAYVTGLLKMIEKKAAAVIAVSQYTKSDFLGHFSTFAPERVFVIHEAPSPVFRKISDPLVLEEVRRRYSLWRPFVLFVGTLKQHKNVSTLVSAVRILKETKGLDHELVLIGRSDERNQSLLEMIRRHSFVRFLGELSDEDLAMLYNLAAAFVLPSFYEGFGLPVIEAMACGTPVIASDRSSLPEVVGSAGALFDPLKVDALCELLYNALTDEGLRKNMISMGLARAKEFSWRSIAEQTMKVYHQAML